jgi:hypothetical protein
MKNSSDIIGNRTRDLPACSTVSQPTAPARALRKEIISRNASYRRQFCMQVEHVM